MELAGGVVAMNVGRGDGADMVVSCVLGLSVWDDASDSMSVSPPTNSFTSQGNTKFALQVSMNRVIVGTSKCAIHVETSTELTTGTVSTDLFPGTLNC